MLLGLLPMMALAERKGETPAEPQVTVKYGPLTNKSGVSGSYYHFSINITIPEGYNKNEIQVDVLNPNVIGDIKNMMLAVPLMFDITLNDNSGI